MTTSLALVVALSTAQAGMLVFAVIFILGAMYGMFTRTGSGIEQRPGGSESSAPGAEGPSELSGQDQGEGTAFSSEGTGGSRNS